MSPLTMTPQEVAERMREFGIATSPDKIRAGIEQGVYPFGVCIQMKTREFEIYRKDFECWLKDRLPIDGGDT